MAKLVVHDTEQSSEAPFLRGILTRSLQESGLPFEDAYELASNVRQQLLESEDKDEQPDNVLVSARTLEATVIKLLRRDGRRETLERYRARRISSEPMLVQTKDGQTTSFSRAYHQRGLQSCGLSADDAAVVTGVVYRELRASGVEIAQPLDIDRLTYRIVDREMGKSISHRYMVWRHFVHSGRPLMLLIGGTAGCGKSTVATAIANRLEIVRTQSTDMLREVMRVMVPERLLPVLHSSSFNAWERLPRSHHSTSEVEALIADGYRAQAELLSVACEAVVQRAMRERVSLILEGVHVHPALMERITVDSDALLIPVMLGVLNAKTLRNRIRGRGGKVPGRRSKRYLRAFDAIWSLQSYLLSEADRTGIAIIPNDDEERVFMTIMRLILDRLSAEFSSTPEEVFSEEHRRQRGIAS